MPARFFEHALEAAQENIDTNITQESIGKLWGLAWRVRSAVMIVRSRSVLEAALR
jgi:hypothetical protein